MSAPARFDAAHLALLACAQLPPGATLAALVARLGAGLGSWDRLAQAATHHQLRPQLAAAIRGAGPRHPPPAAVRAELEAVASANRPHARLAAAEVAAVLRLFDQAGIEALPFKGPVFAAFVGDGGDERELGDIDFLLEAEEVAPASRVLAGAGWHCGLPASAIASHWLLRSEKELLFSHPRYPFALELHWRLAPPWHPSCVTVRQILAKCRMRDFAGTRVRWPAGEELLLAHVSDGMKSSGSGLRWLGDLARILARHPDLDWAGIRAVAGAHGALDSVRIALRALADANAQLDAALACSAGVALPAQAAALALEAGGRARTRAAADSVLRMLAGDLRAEGPMAHFRWALRVADQPLQSGAAVVRHLSGPAMADLVTMPATGEPAASLRWRSFRRRLARIAAG